MKPGLWRNVAFAVAVVGALGAAMPAKAGDLSTCTTADEARAFSLRHLQSRLMVAALACNQRDAYNGFVEAFRPPLAEAGASLIGYFKRTGGGQAALNRHITELANVAGLYRAEDPQGFCRDTWEMFLALQEQPSALEAQAAAHMLKDAGAPAVCAPPAITAGAADASSVVKAAAETPPAAIN